MGCVAASSEGNAASFDNSAGPQSTGCWLWLCDVALCVVPRMPAELTCPPDARFRCVLHLITSTAIKTKKPNTAPVVIPTMALSLKFPYLEPDVFVGSALFVVPAFLLLPSKLCESVVIVIVPAGQSSESLDGEPVSAVPWLKSLLLHRISKAGAETKSPPKFVTAYRWSLFSSLHL